MLQISNHRNHFVSCDMVRSSHRRCSVKKVLLKSSQNSEQNTCARVSFLIKLQAPPAALLKRWLCYRCFPVNFEKCLRTRFLQNTSGRLLLYDEMKYFGTVKARRLNSASYQFSRFKCLLQIRQSTQILELSNTYINELNEIILMNLKITKVNAGYLK